MADKIVSSSPKRERRDRTDEILQAATRLFSEQGFRGTSLATIAEEVGLTQPGLLHYYPNKIQLLQAVMEYREQEDEKKYSQMIDTEDAYLNSVLGAISKLVADNQQKTAIIRLFTVLVAESIRHDHPSHDYFVNRYDLTRLAYSRIFNQLKEKGQIKTEVDTDQIAILFIAIMDGLQIQWLLDPESVDMTESFKVFTEIISSYLQP